MTRFAIAAYCLSSLVLAFPANAQREDLLLRTFAAEAKKKGVVELETRVYRLQWTQANEAVGVINALMMSPREVRHEGKVTVRRGRLDVVLQADARTNSIIAKGTPSELNEIEGILQRIDTDSSTPSIRVEVMIWEVVDHDSRFDKALKATFGGGLPIELTMDKVRNEIIPQLVDHDYLVRPVELRTTVLGDQRASMSSAFRRPHVTSVSSDGGKSYTYEELGARVEFVVRDAGGQFALDLRVEDSREQGGPPVETVATAKAPNPPTIARNLLETSISLMNDAAETHLIGGAGGNQGVRILIVVGVSRE